MLSRFQQGTIEDFVSFENILNNGIYVVDRVVGNLRKAVNCDEYLTHQVVLVNDNRFKSNEIIPAGTKCRCWHVYLVL